MYTEMIREIYAELSPGYRKIADYLISHYRDAAFMTASEIGKTTGVDTAQVVRLAQRLGYPGFPELVAEIQERVKHDLQRVYEPTDDEKQPAAIVHRTLTHDRNNREHMRLHLDAPTVELVVNLLNTAPRIFLIGEGNTSFLAEAFANRLLAFSISAHLVSSELAAQAAASAVTRPDDLFIGLGMTAMSPNATVFLKMARSRRAHCRHRQRDDQSCRGRGRACVTRAGQHRRAAAFAHLVCRIAAWADPGGGNRPGLQHG